MNDKKTINKNMGRTRHSMVQVRKIINIDGGAKYSVRTYIGGLAIVRYKPFQAIPSIASSAYGKILTDF